MAIIERREHTAGGRSRLERTAFRGLALVAVVGLSLLAAACGGGSSGAKVAQVGSTSSTNGSGSSSASSSGNPTAYSACMRKHGVPNFPDPGSTGRIRLDPRKLAESGIDVDSPRFKRAARACLRLQPKGARATARQPTAAQQQAMLRFARCMRSHGVPNFPDPQPGGALDLAQKVAAPNSPQFKATEHTCRNFVPDAPIPLLPQRDNRHREDWPTAKLAPSATRRHSTRQTKLARHRDHPRAACSQ
jgi:hypothetical protein